MQLVDTVRRHLIKIKTRFLQKYQTADPSDELIAWLNKPNSVDLSKHWTDKILTMDDVMIGNNPKSVQLKWLGMDNEKHFDMLEPQGSHWKFNKDNVKYTLNSLGYRGEEPTQESDYTVLVFGDSHTFGVGINDKDVWPVQFKNLLKQQHPNCKVINLSVPGGTNDVMARSLSCCLDIIKPDCVIVCYTYPNRREAIWDSGNIWQLNMTIPDGPNKSDVDEFQSWFMTINEHTDSYNWMKNHKFIKALCKDITLIESQVTQMQIIQKGLGTALKYNDVARDCKHFGPTVHKEFAMKMYERFCSLQINDQNVK